MNKSILFVVLLFISSVSVAVADCKYNGNLYPTGTVIGGLTCQADGSWG